MVLPKNSVLRGETVRKLSSLTIFSKLIIETLNLEDPRNF